MHTTFYLIPKQAFLTLVLKSQLYEYTGHLPHVFSLQYTTKVVSCKPAKLDMLVEGKKKKVACYEVTFEDTILFPEGGGQVSRLGKVMSKLSISMIKSKSEC